MPGLDSRRGLVLLLALAATLGGCGAWKRFGYTGFGRDDWQKPERVIAALALSPGDRVADLGAGGGYFTFRLADAVGPTGRVYAVDVDTDMTSYLERERAERGAANVSVVLASFDDARLPPGGVDLVFTCNTYHHIGEREAYFRRLRAALRPSGRLAVVDARPETGFGLFGSHATSAETMRAELGAAGYTFVAEHDFLPRQHFLVFAAPP